MKLKSYKRIVWDGFIGILAFFIFILLYRLKNPYLFPGLIEKIIWVLAVLLILLIIMSLPYKRIIQKISPILKKMKIKIKAKPSEKYVKFTINIKLRSTEEYVKLAIDYIFQFLLIILLFVLLINEFKKIEFINLNYLLITVLVFGILTIFLRPEIKRKKQEITKKDYYFIILMGIAGIILIYIKTSSLGWLSYLISIIGGILIILLSILILEDDKRWKTQEKLNT